MVNPLGYFAGFPPVSTNGKTSHRVGTRGFWLRNDLRTSRPVFNQRTVTFTLPAHSMKNRYFNSGKKGLWSRTQYALASGVLARHDDGKLHVSISQLGGVAAGAFLSRLWLPASQQSAGAGAVSFGITMASNMGFGVVKEFLPDLGRAITKKRKKVARLSSGLTPQVAPTER